MTRSPLFESVPPTPMPQTLARLALGGVMILAGVGHLTFARVGFQAQVPDILPFSKDFVVLASGVVEIMLGVALIALRQYRIPMGLLLGAFFIAVYPGNIAQYLNHADGLSLDTDAKRLARLPFQPVLVAWALWSTGAWAWLRGRAPRLFAKPA